MGRSRITQGAGASAIAALIGLLGLLPVDGRPDVVRALVWLAIWAPAAGWVSAASRSAPGVPVLWWLALVVCGSGPSGVELVRALLVVGGLFLIGRAAAALAPVDGVAALIGGATVFVATAILAALPGVAGRLGEPWDPAVASRLLDASPVVLVTESAGVDWMRRPGVYEAVGADRFPRSTYAGSGIELAAIAIGFFAALGAELLRARRSPATSPDRARS